MSRSGRHAKGVAVAIRWAGERDVDSEVLRRGVDHKELNYLVQYLAELTISGVLQVFRKF